MSSLVSGAASARELCHADDGAVAALLALAQPASPGGASITADEAAAYVARVPGFGADESVAALGVLARFVGDAASGPQIEPITLALRHHVAGLRISGETVAGLSIDSCGAGGAAASFDPQGANYAGVSIFYSGDGWQTAHAASLALGQDGRWRTSLPGLDANGRITFAVALDQPTGDRLWLNNPREPRPGAVAHVDFSQALALCEPMASPTRAALAELVQSFALPESLGGASVTNDELSWLVAQATWEGGPGIDDPDVIDATVAALDAMQAAGTQFDDGTYQSMRTFLENQRMARVSSSDAVSVQRNPQNQFVQVTAPLGSQWMRVYYSTDGWDTAKVVECTPTGRAGYVSCGLGYVPVGALVSYSAIVRAADGADAYVHASDGGNIFQKIP